ncbi:hypothetical protein [Streptomyces sp. NPDC007346]|uniref:hypothetical protein n=1 Tax=Streptomyces sp. NPDC007346 TaxID=3154682 RepID=UPI0034532541
MPFEDELSKELRRTGETFDLAARAMVVDGALEQGRRSLRRRRSAAVVGSVLALALVGGGGAFGAGLLGSGPGEGTGVASGGPAVDTDGATRGPGEATSAAKDRERTGQDTQRSGERSPDPSRRGANGSEEPPLDYTLLMPTFLKLLPEGLTVGQKVDSGGEFASVVVDDGQGSTLVQINVQPGMQSVADDLYGDATTLPDGTLLATSQQPGEKGGAGVVWWTADTMRTDGLRVVVSAFNSGEQSTPATRPEPALTMEQLTAVATSPEWLKLQPE